MTCEETQKNLTTYLDGQLTLPARAAADAHLESCPVCRGHLAQTRLLMRGLARLERPSLPTDLTARINDALLIERAARATQPPLPFHERIVRWLQPRVMPYTVGALASLLLFIAVSSALRPQFLVLRELARAARASDDIVPDTSEPGILWIDGAGFDVTQPVLAASRKPFGVESPSLNPRGALAALVRTPVRGGDDDDDDTVIVANVFSNGSAALAEVVQPPRNPRMLGEVQDALRKTPAFVPAALDQRPQTMRVVLSLSRVSVRERSF